MGTSPNSAVFTGKMRLAAKALGDSGDRQSLRPVARRVEGVMIRSAAQAGLRRGSPIAGRPWRGTFIRNRGSKDLVVGYASPAHLVNNKTRPHIVGARQLGTKARISRRVQGAGLLGAFGVATPVGLSASGGRKGAAVLNWGGNQFARYVRHPGLPGKQFFQMALPQAQTEGAAEMRSTVNRALSRVFG